MPQYLPLPDGTYLKLQEGETPSAGLQRAQQKYPEAFAQATPAGAGPQSGFMPALKAGATELGGGISALMGKVGLKDTAKAEAEYQAAKARAAQIFKPTEEGWAEAPLTKVGELFGGSLPYMAAPLAAGAAAAALPLTGIAGTAAALGAAGLTSAGQFTATNLARQMEGEAGSVPKRSLEQTDLSSAALAAIPQALLDTAAMRMIPGIGRLFGQAGVKVTAANAKEIAEQTLTKTLTDYALKTGKAAGIEGLTEASQQAFERLQAGLNITDEKARAEYFDSFVGGAVMGGLLSPAGRYVERSGEQRQARGLLEEASQKERKAAADAEEARKKDPTYVLEVAQEYETLNKQKADLQAQIAKGTKEAPLTQEDKDRNTILQQQIAALEPTLKDARKKYIGFGGPDAVKKARESTLELTPPPGRVSEPPAVTEVPGEEETPEAKFARAEQESQGLATLLERQREQIAAATTPEEMVTLAQRAQKTEAALADAKKLLATRPKVPNVTTIEKKLAKAQEAGDTASVIKYAQQLIAARAAAPAAESGLFAPEAVAAEETRRQELIDEMASGREAAEAARSAAAAEETRRTPTPAQLDLLAEGELERDAVQALAREGAQAMTGRISEEQNAQLRAAQQTTMFPESQQRVVRTQQEDSRLPQEARNEIAALTRELRKIQRLPDALPGLPTPEIGGPWSPLTAPAAERDRVAAINRRISDLYKTASPTTETTQTTGMPLPLDQAQIDTRPQPKLQEQVTTLLERVGTDPQTDTETQDLVARVQEQLPAVLRQLQIQSQEEAQQTRARLAGTSAAGRPVQMSAQLDPLPMVYEWAQSVRSGTPAPDLTRKLTTALQTLEQGQRSETEQVTQQAERGTTPLERSEMIGTSTEGRKTTPTRAPTGEIARASQMDLEMPEPTATSFGSFKEFAKYLASDGLAKLRRSIGLVGPTVSRIERFMQPLQQRAQRLRAYEAQLAQLQKSLRDATAEQSAVAEQLVREAQYRVDLARSMMESTAAKAIAAQTLAQQKYADALTQGVDLALQVQENYRAFAQRQADAETRNLQDAFGPVSVRVGAIPARQQAADARKNFERWMDAWVRAEEHKRAVVQKHVGGDWSEGSVADREYADAKKTLDAARKDLQHARLRLSAAEKKYRAADATASTPISDNEVNEYFAKEAQLQEALKTQRRRIAALKGYTNRNKDLAAYMRTQEAETIALQQRLKNATPSTDIGAIITASNARLQKTYDKLMADGDYYAGTPEQFAEFDAALKDLALAQEMQLEVMRETAPPEVRAQAVQAVAAAQRTNAATAAVKLENQQRALTNAAQRRADTRRAPPVVAEETQSEREARDGEARRAEQARLERGETGPREQISFEGGIRYQGKADDKYVKLVEAAYNTNLTSEQRIAAAEAADEYLAKKEAESNALEAGRSAAVAKKEADIAAAEVRIAGNKAKLEEVSLSKAVEKKHKDDPAKREALLEAKREKLRVKIKDDQDKLANHQRLLGRAQGYPKVTRTDPAEVRAYREKLSAEIQRSFKPGKRLGVEEGTRKRAIGPVTRDEVMPPRTMRTGTDESRTGVTTTQQKQPLTEARGVKQRDIPMTSAEKDQARKDADRIREEQAAEAGGEKKPPPSALEKIATVRARVNEINASLDYIEKNPSQTPAGQEKQSATKTRLTMEREKLASELRELYKEQTATETKAAEAAKEDAAEAPEAPAKKKPGRKAKAVDEMVNEEEDLDAFVPEILDGEREDVFLSRGATENPSTTADVRAELSKVFPDLGRVQIFDSVEALIAANPQYEGRIPSDARGFVDTAGNKAFLIAKNINQGQALAVLLHEVGAHIGLKNLLGTAQYNALVKAVGAWAKKNDGSIESRVAKAAQERVEAAQTPDNQQDDELLAYAIEEAVNAGVKPMETKGVLGQWLSQIAQMFRKVLQKFGLPPKALDAQGLVDMAFGAAKMEMRPAVAQVSRRQFLRGAGAALGSMNLPPLSKGMQLDALEAAWNASMDAAYTWFDAAKAAAKTTATKNLVGKYDLTVDNDTFVEAVAGVSSDLYDSLHYMEYGPEDYSTHLRNYLKEKGVSAIAELQQALQAQRTGLVDAVQKAAKESGLPEVGELYFSKNLPTASRVARNLIAQEKGWLTKLRENFLGMGFRAQFVDKLAPYEEALKKGGVSTTKALQAMYFLRMYDQRMHITSEAITEGVAEVVEKTRKDGGTERIIQTKPGANIKQVVDILKSKDVVKAAGSADAANNMFTLYLAAIRAERVGYETLNFGRPWAIAEIKRIETELKSTQLSQETRSNLQKKRAGLEKRLDTMPTEADFKAARAEIEADPVLKAAFDKARDVYNQYNRNLLEFSVQTGALSRDVANKLLAQNDYIPYYRMRDGVAQMVIGGETPIRVGNLKDSPHLKELVGGDEAIFDFLTSSVQNTAMLLDMAMKNLATKNAMFELRDVGLATISKVPKSGKTPEGAVTFKRDGEDYFAIVDTDAIGIDSDLLVKGMAGIPTMFPAIVRLMGMPARVLRRVVVASPVYMARQLFRDSLAASMTSGANITPVLGALRQIGKADVLRGRGITGGQVFTGMPEDVTRMLKEMQAGKVGVSSGLAWLEAKSAQADALTRRAQYQSYLDQGLSEMEATFMALESMNFSKRGLSPTMHMASTLIPFFNAQIQGLDVLYKAFTGKMPMNERLAIREKLLVRGSLMFGMSIAYAMAMQDEEEYKNARPEEKYGNWFVSLKSFGVDEMVRLPIPFELGYVFKALPEALVNSMVNENGGEEAAKAAKHFAMQMVPGLSNYYLPQAVKPALEVALNKSIYTGRDIESAQEQMKEPGFRYRDNTTAAAREIGEFLNISPIKMEYLIRGYTGSMGMALLAAVSAPFGSDEGPQAATKRMSDMPVIGTLFQPKDASGIIDATYARMKEVNMVKETYDDLIEKGRIDDAREYLSTRTNEMALASVAGSFREYMGQIAEYERGIKASSMTPDEKREKLDAAKQMKIRLATAVRAVADKKEPPAALD